MPFHIKVIFNLMSFPFEKTFRRRLAAVLPPETAERVLRAANTCYGSQLSTSPGLRTSPRMAKQVLPMLALYQALTQGEVLEPAAALRLLEPVFLETYFGTLRHGLLLFSQAINKLPVQPFSLLRSSLRRMCLAEEGTDPVIIDDSQQKLIVHCRRCPILEALRADGAPELTSLFCASDDLLASALPRIRWLRSTTLAQGGEFCDFHWERG